jgi:hypothetical protein
VRLRDGQVQTEEIGGPGRGSYEPPSLSVRLREARRLLAQAHARTRSSKLSPRTARGYLKLLEEHLDAIERHLRFERSHPGELPAE